MEAEYARERRRRRTVVILGIILAILAALATYYVISSRPPAGQGEIPQKTIVVAAREIPAQTVIDQSYVTTDTVADSEALASAVTSEAQVIGQVATIRIPVGAPILAGMFGTGSGAGLAIVPVGEELTPDSPDYRAVSVEITDERAVGGMVNKGDRIDLFATVEIQVFGPTGESTDVALLPEGYYTDFTTKMTWSNLEVLDADPTSDLYVLRVDQHQAEEIAHVQGSGAENSFTMSLRASTDAREVDRSGYGETTNRIIEQYNYPIPQIIFLDTYPQPSPQPSPFYPGAPPPAPSSPAPVGSPSPAATPAASPVVSPAS